MDHDRIPQDHATRDRAGPGTWPRVKTRENTIGLQSLVIPGEVFDLLVLQGEKLTALIKPARDVLSLQIHAIVLGRASRPGEEGPWRGDQSAGPEEGYRWTLRRGQARAPVCRWPRGARLTGSRHE